VYRVGSSPYKYIYTQPFLPKEDSLCVTEYLGCRQEPGGDDGNCPVGRGGADSPDESKTPPLPKREATDYKRVASLLMELAEANDANRVSSEKSVPRGEAVAKEREKRASTAPNGRTGTETEKDMKSERASGDSLGSSETDMGSQQETKKEAKCEKEVLPLPPTCDNGCEGEDTMPTHFCSECNVAMCSFCLVVHRRQGKTREHVPTLIATVHSANLPQKTSVFPHKTPVSPQKTPVSSLKSPASRQNSLTSPAGVPVVRERVRAHTQTRESHLLPTEHFQPGVTVRICGLQTKPECNGMEGKVHINTEREGRGEREADLHTLCAFEACSQSQNATELRVTYKCIYEYISVCIYGHKYTQGQNATE